MTDYMTEQEQIEALKRSIKQYAPVVLLGIAIAFIGMSGFRYYQQRQDARLSHASNLYDIMLTKRAQLDTEASGIQANKILTKYDNTIYAEMAAFMKARDAIEKKQYDEAHKQLAWVISHTSTHAFAQIARLRLARVELLQQKPDAAINTLKTIDDDTFSGLINEVRGDAYLALKNNKSAKLSYKKALADLPNAEVTRPLLQMKYDNVSDETT